MKLKGKRALVTGGSKGIGREVIKQLASQGVEVLTVARSEDQLISLQKEIKSMGQNLLYKVVDLSDEKSLNGVIDWVYETGGAEIIVLNAGYLPQSPPFESNILDMQRAFFLNTIVPLYMAERWVKKYQEKEPNDNYRMPEKSLLISSISGLMSYEDVSPAYTGSKAAVTAAYQNLKMAAKDQGLATMFTAIYPHTIATAMTMDKPWTKMTLDVVINSIMGMLKEDKPYKTVEDIVLEIKDDGVYAGMMPISPQTNRPSKETAIWKKIAGNDKVIRP